MLNYSFQKLWAFCQDPGHTQCDVIFFIAEKLHLDVVPISIHGTGIVLNKKAWLMNSGDINIEVFKRVDADDASFGSDYHARTKAFRAFIATKYACQRQRYEKGGQR